MTGPLWFRCVLLLAILWCAGTAVAAREGGAPEGTEPSGETTPAGEAASAAEDDSTASAAPDGSTPAAGDSASLAPGDSAAAGAEGAAEVDRFVPTWKSAMKANDSELKLESGSTVQVNAANGWIFFNTTRMEKRKFRLRDTEEINEQLTNTLSKLDDEFYTFNFRIGNTYMKKTLVGLARFGKDFVVDTDDASFDFLLKRPVLGARSSQIGLSGDARRGPNDFKYDRTLSGGAGAYLRYTLGGEMRVSGGFGTNRVREESEIGSTIKFGAMPSRSDTIRARVDYGTGDEKLFHLDYRRTDGVIRRVTLPRGNSLELLDDPEAAQQEEDHKMGQAFTMTSFVQPLPYLSVDLAFERNADEQKNRVDTRLNNESERTKLKADVTYSYADRGAMSFNIENERGDVDYGPISLGSFREKDKKIGMGISQHLGDSLRIVLRGAMSLNQRFLKKYELNPRDQDIMLYGAGGSFFSVPFSRVKAAVNFTLTRRETVNIDRTLSGDNRVDYLYQFVPSVTVKPSAWASVKQDYTLKFEETDFVFNEERSTLNRTIGVETRAELSVLAPLRFVFFHEYKRRDTGSYLRHGGERLYGRTGENVDNELTLRMAYQPVVGFVLKSWADFQIQQTRRLGREGTKTVILSSNTYDSGMFVVGAERKRSIGAIGELSLNIQYVRRYGPTITELRREYWIVDAQMTFNF